MSKPNLTPLEAAEAETAMQYMQMRGIKYTHVKNETGRGDRRELKNGKVINNWQAMRDAQLGVSPGFPDFVIVLPGVGLLVPELKRQQGNEATAAQQAWVDALNTIPGVEARVCKGASKLIEFIEEFYPLHSHVQKNRR